MGAAFIYSQQKDISLKEELKVDSKNIILQIKDIIYSGATKYNPKGDVLPDEMDDIIKGKIKKLV